jgi:hypothetical protein
MSGTMREQIDTLTEENRSLRSALNNFAETIQESFDELRETGLFDNDEGEDDEEDDAPAPKENGIFADAAKYAGGRLDKRRGRKQYDRAVAAHAKTQARLDAAKKALG